MSHLFRMAIESNILFYLYLRSEIVESLDFTRAKQTDYKIGSVEDVRVRRVVCILIPSIFVICTMIYT